MKFTLMPRQKAPSSPARPVPLKKDAPQSEKAIIVADKEAPPRTKDRKFIVKHLIFIILFCNVYKKTNDGIFSYNAIFSF